MARGSLGTFCFCPSALKEVEEELRGLGFPVDGIEKGGNDLKDEAGLKTCSERSKAESVEEWSVGLPSPILEGREREGWVHCHRGTSRLCSLLASQLSDFPAEDDYFVEVLRNLHVEEGRRSWLEAVLANSQAQEDLIGTVRALGVEIPLGNVPLEEDQFLQTRTIGLAEARKELSCWKDPAQEEISSLEVVNKAVERVQSSTVEEWIAQGVTVVQLPGKAVLTRKSGTGKRRFRAVCCGNHLPTEKFRFN